MRWALNSKLRNSFGLLALKRAFIAICVLVAPLSWLVGSASATTPSTLFNLGTLGGTSSFGAAVNNAGQVTGWSQTSTGTSDAFYWDATNGIVDLHTLPGGFSSWGTGINSNGIIVGASQTGSSSGPVHAFITDVSHHLIDLGTNGGVRSEANAINDNGQVAGFIRYADNSQSAFLWDSVNGFTMLPKTDPSAICLARAINAAGQVVGQCAGNAVYWNTPTSLINLGNLNGTSASASGINDNGQIVGDARGGTRPVSIFVWDTATQTEEDLSSLSTIVGNTSSNVNGINNNGQITGNYDTNVNGGVDSCGPNHAFVWSKADGFSDVGTDGMVSGAQAINNVGQVTGYTNPYYCSTTPPPSGSGTSAPSTSTSNQSVKRAGMWTAKTTKPTVSVGSATVVAGDSGPGRAIQFPITLSVPSSSSVSVNYVIKADASGTAVAGTDFVAKTGTVTFTPGGNGLTPTTLNIATTVFARPSVTTPRTFTVAINSPTGGYKLGHYLSAGSILNDGQQAKGLRASIGNVSISEGDHGKNKTNVWVTLSAPVPSGQTYTVNVRSLGGTATTGTIGSNDYNAFPVTTLTFTAGQWQQAVSLTTLTDMVTEPNETVNLNLYNPSTGLSIGRATGTATILNDD